MPADSLISLPKAKATFIEPMDCLPVSKLPEGPAWVWESLCGRPHKSSSVAFDVMWLWNTAPAIEAYRTAADAT